MTVEPSRVSPGGALSAKMSSLARSGTAPEIALRSALHAAGLRYRVQLPMPGNRRRKIDIAFTRAKVAVFVDGCFWHSCPEHGTQPVTNRDWWEWKLATNKARDQDTARVLREQGWAVVRCWEHEDPDRVVERIRVLLNDRAGSRSD